MSYVDEVYERVTAQNPNEPEFHQAVKEVLDSLKLVIEANEDLYRKNGVLERFVEPERIISFRVPWVDDNGNIWSDFKVSDWVLNSLFVISDNRKGRNLSCCT